MNTITTLRDAVRLHQTLLLIERVTVSAEFAVVADANRKLLQPFADRLRQAYSRMPAAASAYHREVQSVVLRRLGGVPGGMGREEIQSILRDPAASLEEVAAIDAAMADGKRQHDAFQAQLLPLLDAPIEPVQLQTCPVKTAPSLPLGVLRELMPMLAG